MTLQPKSFQGHLIVEVSRSRTFRHTHTNTHTLGKTSLNVLSTRHRGRYLNSTRQTQGTSVFLRQDSNPRSQQYSSCRSTP